MKKNLLVLAVVSALVQSVQAQSSVTVYGKIDLGLVIDSGNSAGKTVAISSGVSGGSRLGFRGEEDLGGGTKLGFVAETGFCADSAANAPNFCTGGNNFMGRQSHLDLRTTYGTLVVGRRYTFGNDAATDLDPFGNGYAGQSENYDGGDTYLVDVSGDRVNNSAAFMTPTYGGLSAGVEIALGETTGDWRAGRETGALVKYEQGPIYATVAYYELDNSNGEGDYRRVTTGGATYDLGVLKLHGLVQKVAGEPTGSTRTDALNLLAGVTVPVYGGNVLASFIRHDDRTSLNHDANQLGLGYVYSLSKRTALYTAYAHISNRNGAAFLVGNATDDGTGDKGFNLGVSHRF